MMIFLCTVVGLKMQQYNQMAVLWWSRKSSGFNRQIRLLILAWSIAGCGAFPSYLNSLSLSVLSCNNSQGCEDCGNIWQVWGTLGYLVCPAIFPWEMPFWELVELSVT